jgi:hypothetical protein
MKMPMLTFVKIISVKIGFRILVSMVLSSINVWGLKGTAVIRRAVILIPSPAAARRPLPRGEAKETGKSKGANVPLPNVPEN